MCSPILDAVPDVGRMALANSASPKHSNMEFVWVPAPDLPHDYITNIGHCEAFLRTTRPVPRGSQFLWHYPIVHVRLNPSIYICVVHIYHFAVGEEITWTCGTPALPVATESETESQSFSSGPSTSSSSSSSSTSSSSSSSRSSCSVVC